MAMEKPYLMLGLEQVGEFVFVFVLLGNNNKHSNVFTVQCILELYVLFSLTCHI